MEDVSLIVPHQANKRIIEAAARGMKVSMDKIMVNVNRYGNTSTASIPLAAVEAGETGRLKKDDKIVLVGFGGGLTWGAVTVIWKEPFPAEKAIKIERYRWLARLRSLILRVIRRIEGWIWGRGEPQ